MARAIHSSQKMNWSSSRIIQWIVHKGDFGRKKHSNTKRTTLNPTPVQMIEHAYIVALRYFAIWLQLNPFSRPNLLTLWFFPTHPLYLPLYTPFPHYIECTIHPYTSINEIVAGMVVGAVDWVTPPTNRTVSIGSEIGISASVRIGSNVIISDVLYFFKLLIGYITFSSSRQDSVTPLLSNRSVGYGITSTNTIRLSSVPSFGLIFDDALFPLYSLRTCILWQSQTYFKQKRNRNTKIRPSSPPLTILLSSPEMAMHVVAPVWAATKDTPLSPSPPANTLASRGCVRSIRKMEPSPEPA